MALGLAELTVKRRLDVVFCHPFKRHLPHLLACPCEDMLTHLITI